jgi:CheY-like chemotaxis protein
LETVGQLTGGIAHDFNNLLTVISGNLQVLAELPAVAPDDLAQQLVASALRATGRGAELTAKLLAFARRQVLQPSRIELAEHLTSLAEMLRRTLDQRIRIELAVAPDCPACIADAGQLEAALLNIAINARDAMPQGGTLTFRARHCGSLPSTLNADPDADRSMKAGYVEISIRDSGSGMTDAVRERAFEPFFTTKEVGRGTGLGLSTVYGFAKQSKGAVTIESAAGHGTTVSLFLPASSAPRVRAAAEAAANDFALPPGLRVLVVEDEADVRSIVQHFLAGWQCEVTTCRDAEEALPVLESARRKLDLLLTDIVLGPGLRGTQLAALGRRLRPALATVLMSGYSAELLDEQEPGIQAPEVLQKPFSRAQLGAAIANALAAARDRWGGADRGNLNL